MEFVAENIRLKELAIVAEQNKAIFDDLVSFLAGQGYASLHAFVVEPDPARGKATILQYLSRPLPEGIALFDGIARPYTPERARWVLLGWVFRDAPTQRLQPMLRSMPDKTPLGRQAELLNRVRAYVATVLPSPDRWTWNVIMEVVLDRLEGSRRAIKGTLFEAIVRRLLIDDFARNELNLKVSDIELKIEGETFDVCVTGERGRMLMPVKTRETMGGGHALLFTRDIHKSIAAANKAGYPCLPVVIAESWGGNLEALECDDYIYINTNPNQIDVVEPILAEEISKRTNKFASLM